jgi:NTE family protein
MVPCGLFGYGVPYRKLNPYVMKIGLSLSGGGYRAAAFHLGTLRKLSELGILKDVSVLSTISGGSITGAYYCLRQGNFSTFYESLYVLLGSASVIGRIFRSWIFIRTVLFALLFWVPGIIVLFTDYAWSGPVFILVWLVLFLRFQFAIFPVSRQIEKIYDQFFYRQATLDTLPERPTLVVGSTNLQTARPFTFTRDWMQDSTYQYLKDGITGPVTFKTKGFPVARAVMASSCVPFAFTPIAIDRQFFVDPDRDMARVKPALVDGGVYDNQGIHKIMNRGRYVCDVIITSDAGNKLDYRGAFHNTFTLLTRTVDVFMARIKNFQLSQDVYDNTRLDNKEIAYLSLGWDLENCIPGFINNLAKGQVAPQVIAAHGLRPEWVEDPDKFRAEITAFLLQSTGYTTIPQPTPAELECARSVGTNLTPLTTEQLDALMKQASSLTELQVKLYCPTLFQTQQP